MICKSCGNSVDDAGDGLYYCATCLRMLNANDVEATPADFQPGRRHLQVLPAEKQEHWLFVGTTVIVILTLISFCTLGSIAPLIVINGVGLLFFTRTYSSKTARKQKIVIAICTLLSAALLLLPFLARIFAD